MTLAISQVLLDLPEPAKDGCLVGLDPIQPITGQNQAHPGQMTEGFPVEKRSLGAHLGGSQGSYFLRRRLQL